MNFIEVDETLKPISKGWAVGTWTAVTDPGFSPVVFRGERIVATSVERCAG